MALSLKSSALQQKFDSAPLRTVFDAARNRPQSALSKVISSAAAQSSSTSSQSTGSVSAIRFDMKTQEQHIAAVLKKIKEGKLAVDPRYSLEDIKIELHSHRYAGKNADEMVLELKDSKMLKSEPKLKPEAPRPTNALRLALSAPRPFAA